MSDHHSVRPEDILPDGLNQTTINGETIRKGTVAAFLANVDVLEDPNTTAEQRQDIVKALRELASAVIAVGLHKHVTFKNLIVEQILVDAE